MTPKEKAFQLFEFYSQCGDCPKDWAKDNAIKVSDEILDLIDEHNLTTWDADIFKFWFEVKLEIKQL